ncbi:MAG: lipopolysaccharide transport periplasmic protein LptA [Cognatishimia sp.]|uniref:lipopolysaccharide transport periplasmic protein LptA n=1 Tax=Cognatishimia sp. TaxID=2211648 RepID=UPI003B8C84D3
MIALTITTGSPVHAQEFKVDFGLTNNDANAPIEVQADSLSVDQDTGNARFEGNVEITQGVMSFKAPLVEVVYSADQTGIASLKGSGGVSIVSGADTAKAETAEYNVDTGFIYMAGNVALAQKGSTISAQRMTVNTNNSTAELHGRVRTVLQPRQ